MSELPDFLSDGQPSAPAAQSEAPAPEVPAEAAPAEASAPEAPAEGPVRDASGRFAPKAETAPAEAAPEPAPVAEAAPPVQPQPAHEPVPLATFLDMRDRAANAEREAKELREWRQQQEARANRQPPPQAPDPDMDPEGYRQWETNQLVASQIDAARYETRLETSRAIAEVTHGAEVVNTAFEWGVKRCDEDQFFNAKVRASKNPVGFVVAEYQREQRQSRFSAVSDDDWSAYEAWKAAQAAQPAAQPQPSAAPAQAAPATPQKPVAPRPSLASTPSAASDAAPLVRDGESHFGAMFGP